MQRWILGAVLVVNVLTFISFALDKWKARRGAWRIPEAQLLVLSACTGAPAGWLAMTLFRHKTIKLSFRVKMVLATLVNVVWIWLWWRYGRGGGA